MVEDLARDRGISVDQFIVAALAEKTSALLSLAYLEERARRGDRGRFLKAIAKVQDLPPDPENDL